MILVAGATGMLGSEIALRLLQVGEDVRVIVRRHTPSEVHFQPNSVDKIKTLIEAGAQPVYCDLKDRPSLDTACRGIERVITTANSAGRGGDDNPQTVDLFGNRNLVDAASQAGVKQFIFISAAIGEPFQQLPFITAKMETEAYLQASGLTYTILAPNTFMEGPVIRIIGEQAADGGTVKLIGGGERLHSFIARSDVASFAIGALNHPAATNSRLELGGPQPLSLRDVIKVYEQVLGREILTQTHQPVEQVPGLDEMGTFMLAGYDAYDSPLDMSKLSRIFDVELTPIEVVIREELANR